MNSDPTIKDRSKTKRSRSFFEGLTGKDLLFSCIYATVTSVIGILLMSVLYEVKVNFTYGVILAGCLFLISILFLYIRAKYSSSAITQIDT